MAPLDQKISPWNHLSVIIAGLLGILISSIVDSALSTQYWLINLSLSILYIAVGTLGWRWVRRRRNNVFLYAYFLVQGGIILAEISNNLQTFQEPQFTLLALPVLFQAAKLPLMSQILMLISFIGTTSLMDFLATTVPFKQAFSVVMLQAALCSAALLTGSLVQRQRDQKHHIQKLALDLDAANQKLAQRLNDLEEKYGRDIRHYQSLIEVREQLLDNTTHDIRNPLGVIMGYAHLIEAKGVELNDPELRSYAEGITHTSDRIKNLVANLLDFAELDTGQGLTKSPVDLREFLEVCARDCMIITQQKQIRLIYTPPLEKITIQVDPNLMHRVIENLVSNAIKYTPAGGEIEISGFVDGDSAIISVRDTGIGIPTDAIPKIFTPFFRVKDDSGAQPEGSGLGLAIARSIIEQHNGEISVESQVRRGSIFSVKLPL